MSKKVEGKPAGCIAWIVILVALGIIFAINQSSTPTPTPTSTPTPTIISATPDNILADTIAEVEGIQSVPVVYTDEVEGGGSLAVVEVITSAGHNNPQTATSILNLTLEYLINTYDVPAPITFSVIINDGTSATDYNWDNESNNWSTTQITLPANSAPTPIPQQPVPGNCATAVAMGLTAQQAAQYSKLDRDKDGVACYGD